VLSGPIGHVSGKARAEWRRVRRRYGERFARSEDRRDWLAYEAQRDTLVRVTGGSVAPGAKIAVFLVYQPAGCPPSTDLACEALGAQGYAVLLVSNGNLTQADRDRLRRKTWAILERPNLGHDFGGYKDGLWFLGQRQIEADVVILLNDSVWFPTVPAGEFLGALERSDKRYLGGHHLLRGKLGLFGTYVPSYFLCFKSDALTSPGFVRFWTDLIPSSDIGRTVVRGEHGINHTMRASGFVPFGPVSKTAARAVIDRLSGEDLVREITYSVPATARQVRARETVLATHASSAAWARAARRYLSDLAGGNLVAALPVLCAGRMGFPFLKRKTIFAATHRALLAAHDDGYLPTLSAVVIDEMRARYG
jgi:hypothetical protein